MAPTHTVEEFRTARRALLKLFRPFAAENRLTEVEESLIASEIDALRAASSPVYAVSPMTIFDRLLECVQWRLLKNGTGIYLWRFTRWVMPRIASYTPPRIEISPDRSRAFVKTEIRPSVIDGAGKGLFALERIKKGVTIGEYSGDIVDSVSKYLRLRDKDYIALTSDPSIFIDAGRRPEVMMRYINHHPLEERRNIRFRNEGTRKFYETTRPIEPGEELLTDYGDLYWRLRGITPSDLIERARLEHAGDIFAAGQHLHE